jgi:hypothetical protein
VGSRLGTHTFWTLALSAAITLLALSPVVLPEMTPFDRLPPPLAGVERVGRIVTSEVVGPVIRSVAGEEEPEAGTEALTTAGDSVEPVPPATPADGVLAARSEGFTVEPPASGETPSEADARRPSEPSGHGRRPPGAEPSERPEQARGHGRAYGHVKARGKGHAKEQGQGHIKYHAEGELAEPSPVKPGKAKIKSKSASEAPPGSAVGKDKPKAGPSKPEHASPGKGTKGERGSSNGEGNGKEKNGKHGD